MQKNTISPTSWRPLRAYRYGCPGYPGKQDGIATGLVSVPLRNMHTSVELLDLVDIKMAGRLLAYFVAAVNREFVEELKCYC